MDADAVRTPQDQILDSEVAEEWTRGHLGDEETQGVVVVRFHDAGALGRWSWQVHVSAAEFVREEPMESHLRDVVQEALGSVDGVVEVAEEDREVWIVAGEPAGRDLVTGVGGALDRMADRLRAHLDSLPVWTPEEP